MCTRKESIFCCFGMQSSTYICQVHLIQCLIQGPCFFIVLGGLSIVVSGVLKSPAVTTFLSIRLLMFVINYFIYLGSSELSA